AAATETAGGLDSAASDSGSEADFAVALAVPEDLSPPDDAPKPADPVAVRSTVSGVVLSVLLHISVLMTVAGLAVSERPPAPIPTIDSRAYDFFDTQIETTAEQNFQYEFANPDDREMDVRKAVNARSVGMVHT